MAALGALGRVAAYTPIVPAGLLTGLLAYWKLDEASGNRLDSTSHHYDLIPTGAPGNAAGRVGQAVALDGSTQYLSIASNPDLAVGAAQDRTWAIWTYLTALTTCRAISKDAGGSSREYILQYDSGSSRWRWVSWHGGTITVLPANTFGAPTINTWHLIIITWTAATARLAISVDGGAEDTSTAPSTTLDANTSAFVLGCTPAGPTELVPGRLDEAGIWNRVLSSGERATLYAAGAGTTYPF